MSKRKSLIILPLLCLFLVCCLCLYITNRSTTRADEISIVYKGDKIESIYNLGDSVVIPDAELEFDGVKYPITGQNLSFPNGKVYSDSEYVLSVPGKYILTCYAAVSGKTVYATQEFIVENNSYSVSSSNSSAYYGNTGEDKGNMDGIIVSLAAGDVFTYEKPLDIRDKKKMDTLINLFALPEFQGLNDVTTLYVRLTDVYDEMNYVDIATFANRGDPNEMSGQAIYTSAGAHNQTLTGMHYWGAEKANQDSYTLYDGDWYAIRKDLNVRSANGYPSFAFSFTARNGYGKGIKSSLTSGYKLSIDYSTKKLYGSEQSNPLSNGMISDLDDSLFYDTIWNGFTNGQVKVSVYADNYVNSTFNFVVTKIYDENLSTNSFSIENKPEIVIDYPTENGAPKAIVNQPYKVFGAMAYSVADGVVDCNAIVYKDYYSTQRRLVNVNENKEFIPSDTQPYQIVYSYTDSFGNTTSQVVDIKVEETSKLDIALSNGVEVGKTGEKICLKSPSVVEPNGDYSLSVFVGIDSFSEIKPDNNGEYLFTPLYKGDYTVKYVAEDYNGKKEVTYTLKIATNPNPAFVDEVSLPVTFVKGAKYLLPTLEGYKFTDADYEKQKADIYYKFDGQAEQKYIANNKLDITASSSVTVIYKLEGSTKQYNIPVTDVGLTENKFYKEKYFFGDLFSKTSAVDRVTYTTGAESAKLEFIKPILMTDFSWSFDVSSASFKNMTVTFTDVKNIDNVLKMVFTVISDSEISLKINEGKSELISMSIANGKHSLNFDSFDNVIKFDEFIYAVDNFEGFEDYTANMKVEFSGVSDKLTINVYNLNDTPLNSLTTDRVEPVYYLDMESGDRKIGDYIVISGFYVEDVIRFDSTKSLTVKGPDNKVLKAEDGTLMENISDFSKEYRIKVDTLGAYYVSAKCSDGNTDKKITNYIYVVDRSAPEITLDSNYATECKLGKSFKIANAVVKDNFDNDLAVMVMVMNPLGKITVLSGVDSYKAEIAGVYTVIYRVQDNNANVTTKYYEVTVK